MKCFFSGCEYDVIVGSWKCIFHMHRSRCETKNCRNQVYARNLCVRHGGKRPCQAEGCTMNSRVGDYCTKHSPSNVLRLCTEEGCTSQVHLRGKCFRHGGNRKCKVEGCDTFARNRGFCARHTPKSCHTRPVKIIQSPLPTLPPLSTILREAPTSIRPPAHIYAEVASLLDFYYGYSIR